MGKIWSALILLIKAHSKLYNMKKILFPTDFSPTAENAFLYALALAKATKAQLTLIHVYELPELGRALKNTTREVYELMEMESLETFKKSVNQLHKVADEHNMGDVEFDQAMVEGEAIYKISQAAKEIEADFIVMGTKGATGLKEVFLGSVTTGVMEEAKVPVLSIPEDAHFEHSINRVAYLTNYKSEELSAFEETCSFASLFKASVDCVHFSIGDENEDGGQMEKWRSSTSNQNVDIDFRVEKGSDIETALMRYTKDRKIDVLAVQPRKKNIFTRLFSKSVSKQIAHHISVPLLSLPA